MEVLVGQACLAVLDYCKLAPEDCDISVLACDDARIAALNESFRDKPTATNVLSWPSEDLGAATEGGRPEMPTPDFTGSVELGDIAISHETCAREAAELGRTFEDHVTHLIVHGTLHLLGYDHIRDLDAVLMQGIETEILGKLGINDPYTT